MVSRRTRSLSNKSFICTVVRIDRGIFCTSSKIGIIPLKPLILISDKIFCVERSLRRCNQCSSHPIERRGRMKSVIISPLKEISFRRWILNIGTCRSDISIHNGITHNCFIIHSCIGNIFKF